MSRPTKPVAMCAVSIDHQEFLMPFAVGLKIVELMQQAVVAERDYGSGAVSTRYIIGDTPRVEFSAVNPKQVVMPSTAPQLTHR